MKPREIAADGVLGHGILRVGALVFGLLSLSLSLWPWVGLGAGCVAIASGVRANRTHRTRIATIGILVAVVGVAISAVSLHTMRVWWFRGGPG